MGSVSREQSGTSSTVNNEPKTKPSLMSKLPPWITEALHSKRSWKNYIRCLIATFVTMVIMVSRKSQITDNGADRRSQCSRVSSVLWAHLLCHLAAKHAACDIHAGTVHYGTGNVIRMGMGMCSLGSKLERTKLCTVAIPTSIRSSCHGSQWQPVCAKSTLFCNR